MNCGALRAAELFLSSRVQRLPGGARCFPAQPQAGVFGAAASWFFCTCCSSPRLDLALASSVSSTGAEWPGCSISRWSDARGLGYSCLEGGEQVGDAGSANPRWLHLR